MCLIAIGTQAELNNPKMLQTAAACNPHGAGIGWAERGACHWRKGLSLEELKNELKRLKEGELAVLHFRIASAGKVCPELCHPFPIRRRDPLKTSGSGRSSLLFHNGTISAWREMALQAVLLRGLRLPSPLSDTALMGALIAHFPELEEPLAGGAGKVAVLTRGGELRLYGRWTTSPQWPEVRLSNTDFLPGVRWPRAQWDDDRTE